jgi:hypothetical protein
MGWEEVVRKYLRDIGTSWEVCIDWDGGGVYVGVLA